MADTRDLADLGQALISLPDLDPKERGRACLDLMDAVRSALAATRVMAIAEATDRTNPDRVLQTQLAAEYGVTRTAITAAVREARDRGYREGDWERR